MTINVEFFTSIPSLIKEMPPIRSSNLISNVFKNIENSTEENPTIKNCPGIIQYIMEGYIIRNHVDLSVTLKNEETEFFEYDCEEFLEALEPLEKEVLVTEFEHERFGKFFNRPHCFDKTFKYNSPWGIVLPEDYSALILPVYYEEDMQFECIPGILTTKELSVINIQFRMVKFQGTKIIKKGTPLAKIVPIKFEKQNFCVRTINDSDRVAFEEYEMFRKRGCPYKKYFKELDEYRKNKPL